MHTERIDLFVILHDDNLGKCDQQALADRYYQRFMTTNLNLSLTNQQLMSSNP